MQNNQTKNIGKAIKLLLKNDPVMVRIIKNNSTLIEKIKII